MNSEILKHAIKTVELKNSLSHINWLRHVKQNIIQDNTTSYTLSNEKVIDNLQIPHRRIGLSETPQIIKYDNELKRKNRNPDLKPIKTLNISEQEVGPISKRLITKDLSDIYQDTNDAENKDEKTAHPAPLSQKSAFINHMISQTRFLLGKIDDKNAQIRLKRLLNYLSSGAKTVANLSISARGDIRENNFDTNVSFQKYLNYMITPDKARNLANKPYFYDVIFGKYIENDIPVKPADMVDSKTTRSIDKHIKTKPLRVIKSARDTNIQNNKALKSLCKKISTIEDVISILSSTAYILGPITQENFKRQNKYFKIFQNKLNDDYLNA